MTFPTFRQTTAADVPQILSVYPRAFPDEELRPVVSALLDGTHDILSLAGFKAEIPIAHVLFTLCGSAGAAQSGALLGPLCVVPDHQQQGIGSTLVRTALERLEENGVRQVFVLGDPNYYGRFGFRAETQVLPPYPLPAEWVGAWQSTTLAARAALPPGQLVLPDPWMVPALWG